MKKQYSTSIVKFEDIELKIDRDAKDVWVTQAQLAQMYQVKQHTISEHISNIYSSGELESGSTYRKSRYSDSFGRGREIKEYNLDMILSLGYRINSKIAAQFRRFSNELWKRELTQQPTQALPEWLTRFKLNYGNTPRGYFSVLSQVYLVYQILERLGYIVPDRADDGKVILLEGSLGYWWLKYLKEHHPKYSENIKTYTHTPLRGDSVQAKCYPNLLLGIFTTFVENDWIPNQASRYFAERDSKAMNTLSKVLVY